MIFSFNLITFCFNFNLDIFLNIYLHYLPAVLIFFCRDLFSHVVNWQPYVIVCKENLWICRDISTFTVESKHKNTEYGWLWTLTNMKNRSYQLLYKNFLLNWLAREFLYPEISDAYFQTFCSKTSFVIKIFHHITLKILFLYDF